MAKIEFKSVDAYIAAQPEAERNTLGRVRNAVREAVPEADETISYHMPTYKLQGQRMLCFAGWKEHYSLYAATGRVIAAFKDELASYEIEKGTIRFPFSQPVPEELIGRIAKFRAKEALERWQPGAGARKKRSAGRRR
ncbi:MAG: DUF1801 domain-containing protein [Acidobacteriia bacterium]|nr:DUF1801 domain-containing protein [Terriglobia bacterium]